MKNDAGPLVSTAWLAAHADAVRIADASWYLPQAGRDPKAEYAASHIPGAVFFDIEDLSDKASTLPHMLCPPAEFRRGMEAIGIRDEDFVVVYDGAGVYSSPRAWWMMRTMGHEKVAILDGGLPEWRRESRPLDNRSVMPQPARFTPRPNPALVRDLARLRADIGRVQVIDARGEPRFTATEPEPRPGVRGGHIPGSRNVPYTELTGADGTLKPPQALRDLFARAGVDLARPAVTSCGSGITAATLLLALERAGARDVALYDGSWAEWGARADTPVETGPAGA